MKLYVHQKLWILWYPHYLIDNKMCTDNLGSWIRNFLVPLRIVYDSMPTFESWMKSMNVDYSCSFSSFNFHHIMHSSVTVANVKVILDHVLLDNMTFKRSQLDLHTTYILCYHIYYLHLKIMSLYQRSKSFLLFCYVNDFSDCFLFLHKTADLNL